MVINFGNTVSVEAVKHHLMAAGFIVTEPLEHGFRMTDGFATCEITGGRFVTMWTKWWTARMSTRSAMFHSIARLCDDSVIAQHNEESQPFSSEDEMARGAAAGCGRVVAFDGYEYDDR